MCGIAGFENHLSGKDLKAYEPVLRHRGPDNTGYFRDDAFSFIHWRLTIIDLSPGANQPFCFENLVLVYNGEIYNYKEIAEELRLKGYTFLTSSDTEVLIKAYHCWGIKALEKFVGMFAFAIYNKQTGEIFVARDRLGVKPLYYSLSHGFAFASELKMFQHLNISLSVDPVAVHQYFRFGFIPGEQTIFREIKKLLPGHYLIYHSNKTKTQCWWSLPYPHLADKQNASDYTEQLEPLLISAFGYRLVSDVPVGVFLSGGIDSSLLAATLSRHSGKKIHTFTIGFDDPRYDESPYARRVADMLGTGHTELHCTADDAAALFEQFYSIYDEPFADTSGIPSILIAQLARKHGVKVVLSADGGDELFGGYPHYTTVQHWYNRLGKWPAPPRKFTARLLSLFFPDPLRAKLISSNLSHRLDRLQELLMANNEIAFFESAIANQSHTAIHKLTGYQFYPHPLIDDGPGNFQEKMMYWDTRFYLPDDLLVKVDRATMYVGVEAREPFLDHRIVEFASGLPLDWKIRKDTSKYILRKLLYRYLPSELFDRPKQGFSIPIFKWFSQSLNNYILEYTHTEIVKKTGLLNPRAVAEEMKKYNYFKQRNQEYNIEKVWRIVSFMMWAEKWLK